MATELPEQNFYPKNVTFYNFSSVKPANGHCEFQQFGHVCLLAEPISTVFGILVVIQGIFGLATSRNVTVGTRYMFSLLFGYGLASAGHTATLWNGFEKTSGAMLNLMQAVMIIRLGSTLTLTDARYSIVKKVNKYFHLASAVLMSTFGLYPIIAHVIGSSFDNSWISWLTFDLIWVVLLVILIIIFISRTNYKYHSACPDAFYLIFNASISCIVAYACWLIDQFMCVKLVATLPVYGIWLLLMGATFYYLTVLDAFLQFDSEKFRLVMTRWPKKFIIIFVFISWENPPKPKPKLT